MNSFILRAVGNLARNPEALAKGALGYARFCLVGSDPEEQQTQHVVTSLWLLAFDDIANDLLKHARKGDQLILEARVRSSCRTEGDGCYRCQNVFMDSSDTQSPHALTDEQVAILVAVALEEFGAGLTRTQFNEVMLAVF